MSLSAKIPSELTSAASVAATQGAGNVDSSGIRAFTKFNSKKTKSDAAVNETAESVKAYTDIVINEYKQDRDDINLKNTSLQAQIDELNKEAREQLSGGGGGGGTGGMGGGNINTGVTKAIDAQIANIKAEIDKNNTDKAALETKITDSTNSLLSPIKVLGISGPTSENVTAARSYLKSNGFDKNYSVVYPLDFSFTIDGIAGIKFGDAVTSNYMPQVYRKNSSRCAFTVLNVSHEVSGNDWTTSCTTVFRVRPGKEK